MNYATLLALLAALSFGMPLLVRLGERAGFSRGSGIALTLAITLFVLIWVFLRRPLKEQAQHSATQHSATQHSATQQQEVQTPPAKNE